MNVIDIISDLDPVETEIGLEIIISGDQGLSLKELSEKTAISVDDLIKIIKDLCERSSSFSFNEKSVQFEESLTLDELTFAHEMLFSILFRAGQAARALRVGLAMLSLHQQMGNKNAEAADLGNLASIFRRDGQFPKAEVLYREALQIHREISDPVGEALDLANLAAIFGETGNIQQASTNYEKAMELLEPQKNAQLVEKIRHDLELLKTDKKLS